MSRNLRIKKGRERDFSKNSIKIFTNTMFFINMEKNSENPKLAKTFILALKSISKNPFSEHKNPTLIPNISLAPLAQPNSFPHVFPVEEKERYMIG